MVLNPFREERPKVKQHKLVRCYLDHLRHLAIAPARIFYAAEVLENYETYLSQRVYLKEIIEAHPLSIQGYIVGMTVRDASVACLKLHLEVLSDFYDFLIRQGIMEENPVAVVL